MTFKNRQVVPNNTERRTTNQVLKIGGRLPKTPARRMIKYDVKSTDLGFSFIQRVDLVQVISWSEPKIQDYLQKLLLRVVAHPDISRPNLLSSLSRISRTRFLLRVVVCHIPKFSEFWNVKINKIGCLVACLVLKIYKELKLFEN